METLLKTTLVVAIIGCINWGLVALFDFNLVDYLFGAGSMLTNIIYIVIMACGIINIYTLTRHFDFDK